MLGLLPRVLHTHTHKIVHFIFIVDVYIWSSSVCIQWFSEWTNQYQMHSLPTEAYAGRDSWRRILSLSLCSFLFFSPILFFFREVCQCQVYSASLFVRSPKIVRRLWMSNVQALWPRSGKSIISKKRLVQKRWCVFFFYIWLCDTCVFIHVCMCRVFYRAIFNSIVDFLLCKFAFLYDCISHK